MHKCLRITLNAFRLSFFDLLKFPLGAARFQSISPDEFLFSYDTCFFSNLVILGGGDLPIAGPCACRDEGQPGERRAV